MVDFEKSFEFFNLTLSNFNYDRVLDALFDPELDPDVFIHGEGAWDSHTPFMRACDRGKTEIVRALLLHDDESRPIDLNRRDYNGNTPLFLACMNGHCEIVEMLLDDDRIATDIVNDQGATVAFVAASTGRYSMMKMLIASERTIDFHRADDLWSETPENIAMLHGHADVQYLLGNFKKNPEKTTMDLRRELDYSQVLAGMMFAMMVYISDDFLKTRKVARRCRVGAEEHELRDRATRFFNIATRLPMELQMMLCNRAYLIPDDIIKSREIEYGLRYIAR